MNRHAGPPPDPNAPPPVPEPHLRGAGADPRPSRAGRHARDALPSPSGAPVRVAHAVRPRWDRPAAVPHQLDGGPHPESRRGSAGEPLRRRAGLGGRSPGGRAGHPDGRGARPSRARRAPRRGRPTSPATRTRRTGSTSRTSPSTASRSPTSTSSAASRPWTGSTGRRTGRPSRSARGRGGRDPRAHEPDHADALVVYARVLAGAPTPRSATMVAVDRLGFRLRIRTGGRLHGARIAFPEEVATADDARRVLDRGCCGTRGPAADGGPPVVGPRAVGRRPRAGRGAAGVRVRGGRPTRSSSRKRSELAAWLHGIVHTLEGDLENARYWYRRARRAFPGPEAVRRRSPRRAARPRPEAAPEEDA